MGLEVNLCAFLILALYEGEWQASCPADLFIMNFFTFLIALDLLFV
jgi:hypothetical protein